MNWSGFGCKTKRKGSRHTECQCDHLTYFTVLVVRHAAQTLSFLKKIKESDRILLLLYIKMNLYTKDFIFYCTTPRCSTHCTVFLQQLEPKPVRHLLALTAITYVGCAASFISCIGVMVFFCRNRWANSEHIEQICKFHLCGFRTFQTSWLIYFRTYMNWGKITSGN